MGEFMEYFREKYSKNHNNETREIMNKQRVKNEILMQCEKYLVEAGDEYVFEVLPKELPYAVAVITEEPLKSRFIINQISESLFVAKLQEVEL